MAQLLLMVLSRIILVLLILEIKFNNQFAYCFISNLKNAGDVAGRTPFQINLTNCAAAGKVATYFEPGATIDFNTGRLLNQATSGAATNVNIQLLGSNNAVIPVLATSTK